MKKYWGNKEILSIQTDSDPIKAINQSKQIKLILMRKNAL